MILWHGTTRRRAEAILASGPDARFVEPGSVDPADGFSAAPPGGPHLSGDPVTIARGKAAKFMAEGGPAIVEFDVPDELARQCDWGGEVRFAPGFEFEELAQLWPQLPKRLIVLP
ncbi:MAG: hypothetical protein K1X57_06775 [Gemmataceae bacterium]|nr:hypothetical protein [Gemmataceae bacterium]